jgi:hypothetical protein
MLSRVVDLALAGLAAYRATVMILFEDGPADSLQCLRDFIYDNYDENHWIRRGFDCPYCISFWMVLLFMLAPKFIREWFAVSEAVRRLVDYDRENAQ